MYLFWKNQLFVWKMEDIFSLLKSSSLYKKNNYAKKTRITVDYEAEFGKITFPSLIEK